MGQSEIQRLAETLAGKGARAWRLDPDGRMEVIAADGRDLWFSAEQVAAARKPAQPAANPEAQTDSKPAAKPAQPAKKPAVSAGKNAGTSKA
jgi:hypothetical protein